MAVVLSVASQSHGELSTHSGRFATFGDRSLGYSQGQRSLPCIHVHIGTSIHMATDTSLRMPACTLTTLLQGPRELVASGCNSLPTILGGCMHNIYHGSEGELKGEGREGGRERKKGKRQNLGTRAVTHRGRGRWDAIIILQRR